jgi:hypothetical protein
MTRRVRMYIWLMRKMGVKEGMCLYKPKWYHRILRIIFFPGDRAKEKFFWLFKSSV